MTSEYSYHENDNIGIAGINEVWTEEDRVTTYWQGWAITLNVDCPDPSQPPIDFIMEVEDMRHLSGEQFDYSGYDRLIKFLYESTRPDVEVVNECARKAVRILRRDIALMPDECREKMFSYFEENSSLIHFLDIGEEERIFNNNIIMAKADAVFKDEDGEEQPISKSSQTSLRI